MPAPDYAWLSPADVARHVGRSSADLNEDNLEAARAGAAAYVERVRADLLTPDGFNATDDVVLGALILAARFYARRGSPMGIASYGEFGVGQIIRLDPDVERLLGIGRYTRPRIG